MNEIKQKPCITIKHDTDLKTLYLGRSDNYVYELLMTESVEDENLFPSIMTVKEGGHIELSKHPGEEIVYMIAGKVELTIGRCKFVLEARKEQGDIAHFQSSQEHSFRNIDSKPARMLFINYPAHRYSA